MKKHRNGNNSNEEEAANSTRKESCPICLEVVKNTALIDSCAHKFCYECLKKWIKRTPVCPLCKKEIGVIMESAHEDTNISDWNKKEQASFSGKCWSKIQSLSNSSSPEYSPLNYSTLPSSPNYSPSPESLTYSSAPDSSEYYDSALNFDPATLNNSPAPEYSPRNYFTSPAPSFTSSPPDISNFSSSPESSYSPPPEPLINELSPDGSEYYDGAEQYFSNTHLCARYNVRPVYYQNRYTPLNIASFRHGCGTDSLSHEPVMNSLNFDPATINSSSSPEYTPLNYTTSPESFNYSSGPDISNFSSSPETNHSPPPEPLINELSPDDPAMQFLSNEQVVESSYAQVIANEEIPMIDLVSDNEEIPVIDLSSDNEIIDLTSDD